MSARDVAVLDERAGAHAALLTRSGQPVRYLGSLLIPDDEVVLCRFEGSPGAVRTAIERAGIPCDRIVRATRSPRTHAANAPDRDDPVVEPGGTR